MPEEDRTLDSLRAAFQDRYRIERLLGEGGMATVYLAEDLRHRRKVAVKVLRPALAQAIGVERFNREIEIAARLNHPHILPLLDSGTFEQGPGQPVSAYYVMPYVEGESLRDRLTRDKRLPLAEAVRFAQEVADALDYAHRRGVVHRDIKPENILLSENHAVVTDFGIARALDEAGSATLTRPGMALGTPAYMSPEQVTGDQPIDGRTDLYALGCTLFEMLAGQPPWTGTMSVVLARRLAEPAPRVRTLESSVPVAIDETLARALAREPVDRYATPGEFAAALATPTTAISRPPRRRSWAVRLGTAALLLVAVIFAITRLASSGQAAAITSLLIAPDSAAPSVAYLSEGIQGAVADLLRRFPQLRVTAPSLVAQVRRQQPGMNNLELGERLKVGAVLTWDLSHSGDSVRVAVELLRIPGGDLLWNARYVRPFADLAAVQGGIANLIADSLRLQFTGLDRASINRRPTASGLAYDLYLRGHRFLLRGLPQGASEARMLTDSAAYYARQAIALDSTFAQAHGLLATYYFVEAFRGWAPFAENIDSSMMAAQRALAVDSTLGDPWVSLISKAIYLDDDWAAARLAANRGLHWSAHDAGTLQSGGIFLGEVEGRVDSAIVLLRRAVEIEPSIADLNTLGDLYMRAGRYDSAVVALSRSLELDPNVPGPRRRLIWSLELLHRYDSANAVRREGGDAPGAAAYALGLKEGAAGYERVRRADLTRQAEILAAPPSRPYLVPDDTVPPLRETRIATLYARLGEWSKAMDWVIREHEHRPRRFRLFVANPLFQGLRTDPRFLPLVRKEGLEALLPR